MGGETTTHLLSNVWCGERLGRERSRTPTVQKMAAKEIWSLMQKGARCKRTVKRFNLLLVNRTLQKAIEALGNKKWILDTKSETISLEIKNAFLFMSARENKKVHYQWPKAAESLRSWLCIEQLHLFHCLNFVLTFFYLFKLEVKVVSTVSTRSVTLAQVRVSKQWATRIRNEDSLFLTPGS